MAGDAIVKRLATPRSTVFDRVFAHVAAGGLAAFVVALIADRIGG